MDMTRRTLETPTESRPQGLGINLDFQPSPRPWASPSIQEGFVRADCPQEDLNVEPDRPIVDVVEIVLDAPSQRFVRPDLAAKAVDLSPTGDAWFDVVPPRVERDLPGPG